MDIDKFVFAGDSAGGHLTFSVAYLAMMRGFRMPDGIFSLYPAFSLDLDKFFPSSLLAGDDEILSSGFLAFCSACTIRKGGNPKTSCFVSPILAPDAMLRHIPPTHIMVSEIDALRDQGYQMMYRMLKNNKKVHLHHMKNFMHGWLQFDNNGFPI